MGPERHWVNEWVSVLMDIALHPTAYELMDLYEIFLQLEKILNPLSDSPWRKKVAEGQSCQNLSDRFLFKQCCIRLLWQSY